MRFTADDVAAAVGGARHGLDAEVEGAAVDSRTLQPGQLFVPVVGERDGHDFVPAALAAGAAAYLSARAPAGGTAIVVEDTVVALTMLGRAARARLPERVVGVTGSVGKTSTKDLLAAVLGRTWSTAASPRSFNNELGVPLTLVGAVEGCEAVVVELGARGRGHVAELAALARPTVGVVTAVAAAHTETFGSLDEVAKAKGELVEALPASGTAVLNAADPLVAAMATRTVATVVRFGPGGDVVAERVRVDDELRPAFHLRSAWGHAEVRLGLRGEHQVANALAAAAAALSLGQRLDAVVTGLEEARPAPWRMELDRTATGAAVLNDAYNANPASTTAALRALARLPARRRVAVLGPMAELGDRSQVEHRTVAALAAELGVEVVAVGTADYGVAPVPDGEAAAERLGRLGPDDAVLVKGSRVAGLERLARMLVEATW